MVNGFQYHHPHDSHVTLGKLLNVSKPQFSHAKKKQKRDAIIESTSQRCVSSQ